MPRLTGRRSRSYSFGTMRLPIVPSRLTQSLVQHSEAWVEGHEWRVAQYSEIAECFQFSNYLAIV